MMFLQRAAIFMLIFLLVSSLGLAGFVVGGVTTHIRVEVSDYTITAGFNNTITIRLTSIDLNLRELRVVLDLSATPLVLFGDNHWKFTYLGKGESVEITVVLYAPESAIGSICSARLELTFGAPSLQPSEVHTINFVVYGWVDIVIYDVEVDPKPVTAGSEVTISANVLNRGNVAAMYTNASILPSDILVLTGDSVSYIGQVDPNAPVPFFLSAVVRSDVGEGVYPVTIQLVYQDDRKVFHTVTRTVEIEVVQPEEAPQPQPTQRIQLWLLREGGVYVPAFFIIVVVLALYIRRRRKRSKLEMEQEFGASTE